MFTFSSDVFVFTFNSGVYLFLSSIFILGSYKIKGYIESRIDFYIMGK